MAKTTNILTPYSKYRLFHGCTGVFIFVVLCANSYYMPIDYYEDLPESCPEDGAEAVDNVAFYRFVSSNPATDSDFLSHRKKYPKKKFQVSECRAMSLSVFKVSDILDLTKLPAIKGIRATVTLSTQDGLVKQTGDGGHHSWWRSTSFVIGNNITY